MSAALLSGVVAMVIASSTAANYNLDNPYYNRRLFDQMDDFYLPKRENFADDRDPALRKKMRFRNEICCGTYTDKNMLREDSIRLDCYEEVFKRSDFFLSWNYFDIDETRSVAKKIVCLEQCLWKKRGTMDDRYDRLTGRLKDRYREGRGRKEPNMNFPEVAVAKCLPSRNPDPASNWFGFGSRDCNRAYLDFSYCVWEELHANCPSQLWDSDSKCQISKRAQHPKLNSTYLTARWGFAIVVGKGFDSPTVEGVEILRQIGDRRRPEPNVTETTETEQTRHDKPVVPPTTTTITTQPKTKAATDKFCEDTKEYLLARRALTK